VREEHDNMSVEQRPDRQTQDPEQFHIPTHAPEYEERVDDFSERNESWFKRYRKALIATGAVATAGATLAAGLALGLKGSEGNSSSKEGQGPVATASANPSHEASPSAAAYDPEDYKTWTADHVPLEVIGADGNVDSYDSVEAYGNSLMIPGVSLEDLSKNPKLYADKLLPAVNSYMSAVNNPQAKAKYADILPADTNSYGGTGAVLDQYVKPGFEGAIVGEPEKGASILGSDNTQEWLAGLNKTAHDIAHFEHNTQGQYDAKWELSQSSGSPAVGYNTFDPNTGTIHIYMRVNLVDNLDQTSEAGQQNADGSSVESLKTAETWNMEVQQQEVGGKQVMRIISMSANGQTM
jgi:hypothetical protein